MARRPHRDKCILCGPFHYQIDRLARSARSAQGCFERVSRHHCVGVEITPAFTHSFFDVLEMLRRVTGLNVAPFRLGCFNFDDAFPQVVVALQGIDNNSIALGPFGMTKARVMLFKDRMVNYGSRHSSDTDFSL